MNKFLENENFSDRPDEELVAMTLENQSFFLYLMKRYEQKLLRYIMRISNTSNEEAEDILQDIFIKVYKNLNGFDPDLKFSSWIYRITHNEVINNFRKNKARPQGNSVTIDDEMINKLRSGIDIEKKIDQEYLKKNIYKILEKIDIKYREILILKFMEEKDYKEISDILKKPMGTVATLINRAKNKFKEELKITPIE